MSYWLLAGLCCCLSTHTGIAPFRIGITPDQSISRAISSLKQRHRLVPVLDLREPLGRGEKTEGRSLLCCNVLPQSAEGKKGPLLLTFMEKPLSLPLLRDVGFGCKLVSLVLSVNFCSVVVAVVRSRLMIGEMFASDRSRDRLYSTSFAALLHLETKLYLRSN
jgi:hypothetical protein